MDTYSPRAVGEAREQRFALFAAQRAAGQLARREHELIRHALGDHRQGTPRRSPLRRQSRCCPLSMRRLASTLPIASDSALPTSGMELPAKTSPF